MYAFSNIISKLILLDIVLTQQIWSKHRLNWACKWSVFSNKSNPVRALHQPWLFSVSLALNDRFWSITFLHKWNTLKQRVVPVKAMWFQTPTTDTQVLLEPFSLTDLRDCLAPNTVFVSEMAAISGWSQAEGLFWTCEGQTEQERSAWGERRPERAAGARSGRQREGDPEGQG